jgi:hypothetical protein
LYSVPYEDTWGASGYWTLTDQGSQGESRRWLWREG